MSSAQWDVSTLSGHVGAWGSAEVLVMQTAPAAGAIPPPPCSWKIALWTSAPGSGSWVVSCGIGARVPVPVTPSASGSDVLEVPGAGVSVRWVPISPSVAGEYLAAAAAPMSGYPAEAFGARRG